MRWLVGWQVLIISQCTQNYQTIIPSYELCSSQQQALVAEKYVKVFPANAQKPRHLQRNCHTETLVYKHNNMF